MKKALISIALILVLTVTFTVPALAATGNEILMEELINLQSIYGSNAQAQKAISEAIAWLNANTVSVAQANEIIGHLDSALAIKGSTNLGDLSQAQANSIIKSVQTAASVVGVNVSVDLGGEAIRWTVSSPGSSPGSSSGGSTGGDYVYSGSTERVIKQTGADFTLLISLIVGVTALFGAAIVVAVATRKKRSESEAA